MVARGDPAALEGCGEREVREWFLHFSTVVELARKYRK